MIEISKATRFVRQEILTCRTFVGQHRGTRQPVVVWSGADDLRFVFQRILELIDIVSSFGDYIIAVLRILVERYAIMTAVIQESKTICGYIHVGYFGKGVGVLPRRIRPVPIDLMGVLSDGIVP